MNKDVFALDIDDFPMTCYVMLLYQRLEYTPPKFNIAPENGLFGRLRSFWEGLFSLAMLVSGRAQVANKNCASYVYVLHLPSLKLT